MALWRRHLRHNPANPHWPDRDRFVLSNGHGSMLLYALLHLTGYDLPMEELRASGSCTRRRRGIRRSASRRAWRPPPGRSARGSPMRWAWRSPSGCSRREFNRPGHTIVDHHTYVFVGDGCLMEGISHEACSLAGTLGLGKLVVVLRRQRHLDRRQGRGLVHRRHAAALRGLRLERDPERRRPRRRGGRRGDRRARRRRHGPAARSSAARRSSARARRPRPGTATAHGAALGEKEVAATRAALGWTLSAVRDSRRRSTRGWDARERGARSKRDWNERFAAYARGASASSAAEFRRRMARRAARRLGAATAAAIVARARRRRARRSPRARRRSRRSRRWRPRCRN